MDQKAALHHWLGNPTDFTSQLPSSIEVIQQIDKGGQAIVFQGKHNGILAAIKLYYPGQISQRVEREVNALRVISCSTMAALLWDGEVDFAGEHLPVVATEFVEGTNLRARIPPPLTEDEIGIMIYDVAVAISALWSKRIVHRDLKPANIIQRTNGRYCVIDLGLARHLDDTSLTAMGFTGGTIGYLSPEQAKAVRKLSCRSDVFSLGVIALVAAMGRHPTASNQVRLVNARYDNNLPNEVANFRYAPLLKAMLAPTAIQRPLPEQITEALDAYRPRELDNGS